MPFERSAQITLHNLGAQPVQITSANILHDAWQWDDQSLYFHANWKNYPKFSTGTETNSSGNRAFDINYIDIKGRGKYVGDTLTVFNGTAGWWGEGDEKIYIDGETFPSHFGTGTEDYYGYAWCRPEFFEAPFHAQPNGEGDLLGGFVVNCRFRALDAIPFNRSLDFDMEMFHSRITKVNYAPTTYWYAQTGAQCNIEPAPDQARWKIIRDIEEIAPVFRVPGALEGEKFNIIETTGGTTRLQATSAWGWSANAQLWWIDGQPKDRLVLAFEADKAGQFNVQAGLTNAVDYAIVKIAVNGQTALESLDLYNRKVITVAVELGECHIKKGVNQMEITIIGANDAAIKRYMFGLDYLTIK